MLRRGPIHGTRRLDSGYGEAWFMLRQGSILATGRLDSSYGEDLIHGTGTFDSCYCRLDPYYGENSFMLRGG